MLDIHIYDIYVDRDCQNNLQTSPYACRPRLKMKLTQNCCSINTFGRARSLTVPAHCAAPVVLLGGGGQKEVRPEWLPALIGKHSRARCNGIFPQLRQKGLLRSGLDCCLISIRKHRANKSEKCAKSTITKKKKKKKHKTGKRRAKLQIVWPKAAGSIWGSSMR